MQRIRTLRWSKFRDIMRGDLLRTILDYGIDRPSCTGRPLSRYRVNRLGVQCSDSEDLIQSSCSPLHVRYPRFRHCERKSTA